jgi:tetratricopeptide (TPR) repeat protein
VRRTTPAPESSSRASAQQAYRTASRLLVTGETDSAIAKFNEALAARPGYAPAYRGLGLAYERRGDTGRALRYYKKYLRASPDSRDADAIRKRVERLGG